MAGRDVESDPSCLCVEESYRNKLWQSLFLGVV